jgi:tetratricopeptide (TPR) repeat protein
MKRLLSGTLVASFALSSVAGAAGKYSKQEAQITATQTAITKPTQHVVEKKKPTITAEDVFGGVGEKVKSVTDAQIKVLARLIDNTSDSDPEKPDLLFRMAELYNEQYRYYDFRARELDEKVFDAGNAGNTSLASQLKANQTQYQQKAQQWLLASAKEYLEVADHPDKYGSYKRMDEVLFYLAYMLTEVKKEDAARKYFKRLIKDYPKSKFVPWAFFAFGQYYFENKDFENAMKFYDRVLQFPESSVYSYAKYYEGWVYFNLGDFKQSLATFVSVIEMAKDPRTIGPKQGKMALGKEAKKDSVRAYARVGTPDKAWEFFKRIGGDYAMTMMEQLGELYNGQGQFTDSIKVYRNLMTLEPNSPKVCNWQYEVMKNTLSYTGSRAAPDTVKELQRLSAVYEKFKADPRLKKDQQEECRDNTSNTLRELATVWHKEAQRTNNNETYALAQYLYKEYLTRFPGAKDVYPMTYYYAELLWKLGSNGDSNKYCEAGPVYTQVVKLDPKPDAKYLKDAAFAAVLSWKNCLNVDESGADVVGDMKKKRAEVKQEKAKEKGEEDAPPKPEPITPNKQKMIDAFDTYIKYVPNSPELTKIKYNKARIYYETNRFDEAAPLFKDIADNHADSEMAPYAANLLFDCFIFKHDYDALQGVLDNYCPKYGDKDASVKAQCTRLSSDLGRKRIEIAQKQGRFKEAAALYMQQAADNPTDPKIDEVYYNAALLYDRVHLIGLAIRAFEALLQAKPDSVLAKKAIYIIGKDYAAVAWFDKAAEKYEEYASRFPGEKDSPQALNTASFFRRGLGDNDKAIKDTDLFVSTYGGRHEFIDKAAGVAFDEAQIFEQAKDWDRVRKHFVSYLKQWGVKGGVDREIIAQVKLGDLAWRDSCPLGDGVNGACIELQRVRSGGAARAAAMEESKSKKTSKKGKKGKKKGADLPKQCGPETKSKVIVHDRKPAQLKEAMAHYAEALKLYRGGAAEKSVPGSDEQQRASRVQNMAFFAAGARFKEGDLEYEKLLKMPIPDKLDFTTAPFDASAARKKAAEKRIADNQKKFKQWRDAKEKQLLLANNIYKQVIASKQAHWVIAASARIGQLAQDFSGQLYTATVPKASVPAGFDAAEFEQLFHDSYCDALVDAAEPIEGTAIVGFTTCLEASTRLSFYDEWSQLCENELNQLKPIEYPLASEIRAQPGYVAIKMDQASVQPLESK